MGSISSGVGLVSGLDHDTLIENLMQIERRTLTQIKTRMTGLDSQKAAFLDISARISGLLSRVQTLMSPVSFRGSKATSSNADALAASVRPGAANGSYQFLVRSLASTQHTISRGFSSSTAALTPGTVTIESAAARVNRSTELAALNGQSGVERGSIRIFNRAGASALIDLSDAMTLSDVLDRIGGAGIGVTASVYGDALLLTDASTGAGRLRVEEVGGGQTAANLGFTAATAADADNDGRLGGAALTTLNLDSALSALNDGLGVRRSIAGGDFLIHTTTGDISVDLSTLIKADTQLARLNRGQGVELGTVKITARNGTIATVDLSAAKTVGEVETALEAAFGGGKINVTLSGSRLVVTDATVLADNETAQTFSITDVTGHAARDLGLDGAATDGNKIDGRNIVRVDSLADVLAAINEANSNLLPGGVRKVTAALSSDGQRITLTSAQGEISLSAGSSQALRDLGLDGAASGTQLTGRRIASGLNTSLLSTLRGGTGISLGMIRISSGTAEFDVDLTNAETLDAALERIRSAGLLAGVNLNYSYDATGTRFSLTSASGAAFSISDVDGDFAKSFGIDTSGTTIRSANVQRQYVGENTRLASVANGRGVTLGTIRITNSLGVAKTVDLTSLKAETIGDVIYAINGLDLDITARINDTGDGILIADNNAGGAALKVEDLSGTAARDLNLLGSSTSGSIDGSFEYRIAIGGTDTLATLAARIGANTSLATASVLNDGSAAAPYRLSIVSRNSGRAGELIIDDGGSGLGLSTLTAARDARVLFGGAGGLLLTSSSNTFTDAVDGLTITASAVSDQPVTVTIGRDIDAAVAAMQEFVENFNQATARIKEVGKYDAQTEQRGILLGDATLRTIETRMFRMISRSYVGAHTGYSRLSQFGVKLSSGSELTFDESAFRAAVEADPEGVAKFFSDTASGVATTLKKDLEALTDSQGLIQTRTTALDGQRKLLEDRSTYLDSILTAKEARLRREFEAMELALSQLQSQSTALSQLSALSSGTSTSTS